MVKRKNARILSFVLTLTIIMSMFCMGTVTASAVETDIAESGSGSATAVLNNTANWSTCYVYYWGNDGGVSNASWPGVKLTDADKNSAGYYEVEIAEKYLSGVNGVIFHNNGSGKSADLSIASGDSKIYNNSDGSWKEYDTNPLKLSFVTDVASPQYNGTSIAITATSSGATGTCTYTFKANTTTIYTGTKNTCTWTPSTAGSYTLSVSVKDTAGNRNEKTQAFEIKDASNVAEPVLKGITVGTNGYGVVNQSTAVKVNAAGGKVGTNLLFYKVAVKDPSGNAVNTVYYTQNNTLSFKPTKTGNYTAEVSVQNSYNAVEKRTFTVPVQSSAVNPTQAPTQAPTTSSSDPVISSFTADKTTVSVGSAVKFTATVKSGTGKPNFTYTFKANETTIKTISSANRTESYSWTPTEAGTYTIKTVVKDANAKVVYKTMTVTVTASSTVVDPEISSFTADKTTVSVGSAVKFTTTLKSGTGKPNFTYTFKANETTIKTISSANRTESYSWTPTEVGTYTIKVVVKDANAKVVYKTMTVTVTASSAVVDPVISSFTADKTTVSVGSAVKFTTTLKSGTGKPNFTYTFKANETTIKTISSANRTESYSWTPTEAGTYTIKTVVKDANAKVVYKTMTVTVTASSVVDPEISSFTADKTTVDVGSAVKFTTTLKSGTGKPNFTYTFKANETTIKTISSANRTESYSWTPTEVGTYTIKVVVKDANAKVVYKTVTITVKAVTYGGTFTKTHSTDVNVGDSVHLKAVITGGQPNYTYTVKVNGAIAHVQSLSAKEFDYDWVAPKAGDYKLSIVVKDASGAITYKNFSSITVAKASTSYIKGDVDGNGKVTSADAQYVLCYLTGTAGYTIKSGTNAFKAADMDGDGVITYNDAILITRML